MASHPTRRDLLLGTATGFSALAGCASFPPGPSDGTSAGAPSATGAEAPRSSSPRQTSRGSPSPPAGDGTRTATGDGPRDPTASPPPDDAFAFEATVTAQATPESPARVRASLTNEWDRPVHLGFGFALLYSDTTGDLAYGGGHLVVLPIDVVQAPRAPSEPTDGCWVFGQPLTIPSILQWRTLAPGESIDRAYRILRYDAPENDTCLRPGTYRFQDSLELDCEGGCGGRTLLVTLALTVHDDGRLSAVGRPPVVRSSV